MSDSERKDNAAYVEVVPKSDYVAEADVHVTQYELAPEPGLKHRHVGLSGLSNGDHVKKEKDPEPDFELKLIPFNPLDQNIFVRSILLVQTTFSKTHARYKVNLWKLVGILLLVAFLVYVGFAIHYEFGSESSYRLVICTALGLLLLLFKLMKPCLQPAIDEVQNFCTDPSRERIRFIIRWVLYVLNTCLTVALIIWLVALDNPENLLSLAGLAAFIVIGFVTSYSPAQVNWHPVFWGFSLQFYLACFILKTDEGYDTFKWLGDRFTEFLAKSDAGARFVFGDYAIIEPLDGRKPIEFMGVFTLHYFVFQLGPMVVFFSSVIAVLYYLGVMQAIVNVLGHFLAFCLGTTPAESLSTAGNIFMSMVECPMLIRPFIPTMTRSELLAVMTAGFATVSGSVLGIYVGFGVQANHLLSASVMSAPAALAISKLTFPEIEIPDTKNTGFDKLKKIKEGNIIEAASNGATMSIKIISCMIVNIIAFLSILEFVNSTLLWFGERVGKHDLTFEYICSYVLYPVALFMGTKPADCRFVAELVGLKTLTNEFIAYERLGVVLKNRIDLEAYEKLYPGQWEYSGPDINLTVTGQILPRGVIDERSEVIVTYALCGFATVDTMGIVIGIMSAMAPERRPTIARLVLRAMLVGNVACFMTACVAGLFYESHN